MITCVALLAGERIQEQSKMGREGSRNEVLDITVPPYVIWKWKLIPQNVELDAKGTWYIQPNPDNRGDQYTRVWLLCSV